MPAAVATPDLTRTFGVGADLLEHPVDVLGRARFRASLDRTSVHVTRSADPTAAIPFAGTAILFGKRTWIGSKDRGFWEQIAPQAVTKTLQEADVRFLQNHNPDLLLARTNPVMRSAAAATLSLTPTPGGLAVESDMAPTSYAQDLAILLERGDISQMSFAFDPVEWTRETLPDGTTLITITELRLYDVSVVTYPAYEETDAGLRAAAFDHLCRASGFDPTAVLRGYANAGGAMPETTAPIPALADGERMKRAMLAGLEERSLNGWTMDDLWRLLDAAAVELCSTETLNAYWYVYITAVSDEWFVYYDSTGKPGRYYQVTYTITADGVLTLGTPVEVIPKTTYLPVAQPADETGGNTVVLDEPGAEEFSAAAALSLRTLAARTNEIVITGAG